MITFDSIEPGKISRATAVRLIAEGENYAMIPRPKNWAPRIGYEVKIFDGKEGVIYVVHDAQGYRIRKYYNPGRGRFDKEILPNARRQSKPPAEPPRTVAYHNYLITHSPFDGYYYVSRERTHIGTYQTLDAAKNVIDTFLRNPAPRIRSNPRGRPGTFKIYDDVVSIVARKRTAATTGGNAKRRGTYEHKFKTPGTAIFGLADGSLLIKGSKPLWEKNDESRYEI